MSSDSHHGITRTPVSGFDPHDPSLANRQHKILTDLLERCPVSWSEKHGGFWSLTKFDDIVAAARDYETYTVEQGVIVPSLGASTPIPPAQVDPPAHSKYRKLLLPFFNPKAVLAYEDTVRMIVREAIAEFADRGVAELSRDLAHPVPTMTIAAILGLDKTQWRVIRDLVDDYLLANTQGADAKKRAAGAFEEYLHDLIKVRCGVPVTDVLGTIVNSEIDGEPIPMPMLLGMVHVLISAGHETTINGIANVMYHLLTIPGLIDRVRTNRRLIPAMIAESLRLESPVMCMARTVVTDTEMRGAQLAADDKVILVFGAGNLDPERFEEPTEFRMGRENSHVAFGSGPHRCVGEHLAKVEMRVAVEEMLDTFPDLHIPVDDPPVWGSGAVRRGVRKLPVRFTPIIR
ncbi:cytochrome P450 [Mycobacterium sp. pUA109]|uniref:cytochrome P450 n=1 Tax=Mycobacterium sp. pUA109 TaxID=3238982 RepID=UPI00351B1378